MPLEVSARARVLLGDLEADPFGVGFMEIDELLDEWGITESPRGDDVMGYRLRCHGDLPAFAFYYPLKLELAPTTVRNICNAVRELERRLSQ